jgi:hypothetical protein
LNAAHLVLIQLIGCESIVEYRREQSIAVPDAKIEGRYVGVQSSLGVIKTSSLCVWGILVGWECILEPKIRTSVCNMNRPPYFRRS